MWPQWMCIVTCVRLREEALGVPRSEDDGCSNGVHLNGSVLVYNKKRTKVINLSLVDVLLLSFVFVPLFPV